MSVRTCGFGKKQRRDVSTGYGVHLFARRMGLLSKKRFLIRSGIETDWHSGKKVFFR